MTISFFLLALVLALPGLSHLKMLLVMDDLIDKDFTTYEQLKDLNESYKDKNHVLLVVQRKDDRTPEFEELCGIRAWVQRLSMEREDIKRIVSSFGAARVENDAHHLSFKPLLDLDCGRTPVAQGTIDNDLRSIQKSPWGMSLTGLAAKDVVVMFYLNDSGDPRFGSFDGAAVGEIMKSFNAKVTTDFPGLEAHWSGVATYQYYTKIGYDQTNLLNLVTFSMVFVLFRFIFGTFTSSLLFLLSYILTLIPMFEGMGATGAPIDVLSNSLSLMMLIACVEDFLFVSYIRMRRPDKSWRYAFRVMLIPSFFTSLTTAIGFGSLYLAQMGIIRRFGLWAAFAALMEWFMVYYFLPSLLVCFPRLRNWADAKRAFSFDFLNRLRDMRVSPTLARASILLFVVALAGASSLKVSDAPENVFPKSHPLRIDANFLEKTRSWITDVSLIFDDYDERKRNEAVLTKLEREPMVKAIQSPYAANDYLRSGLSTQRADLVSNMWSMSPAFEHLVSAKGISARALIFLNKTDIVEVNALKERVDRYCAGHCHLSGTLISYGEFGTRVLQTFLSSMNTSLILVLMIVLFLSFALEVPNKIPLLLSLMWGPAVLLAIFVIFEVPLFYVTSIFASILIGMAGDNTIQFMFARGSRSISASVRGLGTASILLAISMCTLSTVLFLSYFTPLKYLGAWMILGVSLTLFGELWILKGLTEKSKLLRF